VSAVATETEVAARRPEEHGNARRLFQPSEVTLEDSILGAWEALVTDGRTQCPVCRGELEPGGCATCGSQLS
jgi:DnaJ-class molecular chaperone